MRSLPPHRGKASDTDRWCKGMLGGYVPDVAPRDTELQGTSSGLKSLTPRQRDSCVIKGAARELGVRLTSDRRSCDGVRERTNHLRQRLAAIDIAPRERGSSSANWETPPWTVSTFGGRDSPTFYQSLMTHIGSGVLDE